MSQLHSDHDCLVAKETKSDHMGDHRSISLCNVTNKIISKIWTSRLAPLLSLVVAPNQSGFIKGRLLSDNALLAQKIIHDLDKELTQKIISPNLALKLDMAKAYDRVQWPFLLKVLEKMGFPAGWVSMIRRCISSCWFSVLVNGSPAGFFQFSRGLGQGDPISPSFSVHVAYYFSRCLDNLIVENNDMICRCCKSVPMVSHLSYADDFIIFSRAQWNLVGRLMQCLEHYSAVSSQMVNNGKSQFCLASQFAEWASMVEEVGGFREAPPRLLIFEFPSTVDVGELTTSFLSDRG